MSFKLKSIAAVAVLAAASLNASAAVEDLGTVVYNVPTTFAGGSAPGAFIDTFTFTLPANSGSGYSVLDFSPKFFPTGSFSTLFSSIALFSNADGILSNADDAFLSSATSTGTKGLSLSFGPTAAGNYYLTVAGVTNGTLGGMYSGAISVNAVTAPVPEPETYAMLLAGLGIMGAIARRRKV